MAVKPIMEGNGLNLLSISSNKPRRQTGSWEEAAALLAQAFDAKRVYACVAQDAALCLGIWNGQRFELPPGLDFCARHLQFARVFDLNKEVYIWRQSGGLLAWRLRDDSSVECQCEAVEARQLIWGKYAQADGEDNAWACWREDRGVALLMPADLCQGSAGRLWLRTRHYTAYNEESQAGYVDFRFVAVEV